VGMRSDRDLLLKLTNRADSSTVFPQIGEAFYQIGRHGVSLEGKQLPLQPGFELNSCITGVDFEPLRPILCFLITI